MEDFTLPNDIKIYTITAKSFPEDNRRSASQTYKTSTPCSLPKVLKNFSPGEW